MLHSQVLNLIQFLILTSISLRLSLILSSHLRLGFPKGLFLVGLLLLLLFILVLLILRMGSGEGSTMRNFIVLLFN